MSFIEMASFKWASVSRGQYMNNAGNRIPLTHRDATSAAHEALTSLALVFEGIFSRKTIEIFLRGGQPIGWAEHSDAQHQETDVRRRETDENRPVGMAGIGWW
jgi:hypothetical protein